MISLLIAALLPGASASATTAPPAPAVRSLQARFDEATAAHNAGRYDDAVKGFEVLENLSAVQRNSLVLSTIRLRKGMGLIQLNRIDEAESTLRAGLKTVPLDRAELRVDRYVALTGLGKIAEHRVNYAVAGEEFKKALELADDPFAKVDTLLSLSRVKVFDPGDAAIRYAEEALAFVKSQPDTSKANIANVETIYARALLNKGRFAEALAVLKKAMSGQGGLDLKVDANEIITRSDLAIAALLSGKNEEARKYLAYTGAGRIQETPFRRAVSMQSPPCGGAANLQPDDVAVVEFSIMPDGSVGRATPIYASVNGPAALEFARAVSGWSWQPDDVVKIPELFKAVTRVELRCTAAASRPPVDEMLTAGLSDWLTKSGAPAASTAGSDALALGALRAELSRRVALGGGVRLIPVLLCLGANSVASDDERKAWLAQARDEANTAGAPLAAVIAIEIRMATVMAYSARNRGDAYRRDLRALLARSGASDSAIIANTLKLLIAEAHYRLPAPPDAVALLHAVADDSRLPARHQLRVGALVRLAALQAATGDLPGAAATYKQTGLEAQQCALLDAKPALLSRNTSRNDYPLAALQWGFEGWVHAEFDIRADGKTASQRAIIAYPPFVFKDAAIGITKKLTYAKSYRPDGAAGCSGEYQSITFSI